MELKTTGEFLTFIKIIQSQERQPLRELMICKSDVFASALYLKN